MSEFFPDGTVIDSWFYNDKIPNINDENNLYYLD